MNDTPDPLEEVLQREVERLVGFFDDRIEGLGTNQARLLREEIMSSLRALVAAARAAEGGAHVDKASV